MSGGLDVAGLRSLLAAATPGPWRTYSHPAADGGVWATEGFGMAATGCGVGNAALIAAAVNALPALLDELAAARERVRVVEGERDRLRRWKDEALGVIGGLQRLGRALNLRLGEQITGNNAAEAAEALRTRAESAEAALASLRGGVEAAQAKWSGCWCDTQMSPDHDPRVQDCPQHGDASCQHMAEGITVDLRALLAADVSTPATTGSDLGEEEL